MKLEKSGCVLILETDIQVNGKMAGRKDLVSRYGLLMELYIKVIGKIISHTA